LTQGWIDNATKLFSKVVYSGWITHRLALLKRFVLKKTLQPDAHDMGKLEVIDDLLTGVFYLVYLFHVLQYMEVQTGLAIKVCDVLLDKFTTPSNTHANIFQSLFSIGATGTLVFGLASKDLAAQIMSGLTLHLSDKMFEVCIMICHDCTSHHEIF
jgi:hypothetical protein